MPGDAFQPPARYVIRETMVESPAEVLYRGWDKVLRREVILKRLGPAVLERLRGSGNPERILDEARALAQVQHRGIVRLMDVLECPGGPLLVMEPLSGESLGERLERDGPLAPEQVTRLGVELADALAVVHAVGAVHRGLSLGNIVINDAGEPCLTGFLFAKFSKPSLSVTSISYGFDSFPNPENDLSLLPAHPAPEQLSGQAADARSDLFGLGCVLYRALTGKDAFGNLLKDKWFVPQSPTLLVPGVPNKLALVILKCVARSPLKRFQSAGELKEALEGICFEQQPPREQSVRRRIPMGAVAVVALVAILGVWRFSVDRGGRQSTDMPGLRGRPVEVLVDGSVAGSRGAGDMGKFAPRYDKSYALLIGIGNAYRGTGFSPLPNAERDIDAIAARLRAMAWEHWHITTLKGAAATQEEIMAAKARIGGKLGPNDRLLVFYAGHGERHEKASQSGWLIPADARPLDQDIGRSSWLRFDEFAKLFEETDAKHVLIAMDCCYSGRLAAATRGGSERRVFAKRFLTNKAYVVISSGRGSEQVSDGSGDHSPFANAFLAALSDDSGAAAVTSTTLFSEIQTTFTHLNLPQVPLLGRSPDAPDGEFVFFLRPPN